MKFDIDNWLHAHSKRHFGSLFYVDSRDVRKLVEALEKPVEAKDERPWIPISKDYPREPGFYEVTHGVSGYHCTARMVSHAHFNPNSSDPFFVWNNASGPVLYVLAWRQLPEPYDGVSHG